MPKSQEVIKNVEQSKLNPDDYYSKRRINECVYPWTEDDVEEVWNDIILPNEPNDFATYIDRLFCDIDNDEINELILTVDGANGINFKIFSKHQDGKIIELHNELSRETCVYQGIFLYPPTNEDDFVKLISAGYNDMRDLKLYKHKNDKNAIYITGILSRADDCAYIAKICYNALYDRYYSKIIYRWGLFREGTLDENGEVRVKEVFHCYKYIHDGDLQSGKEEVSVLEIENFLSGLYSDTGERDNFYSENRSIEPIHSPWTSEAISGAREFIRDYQYD